MKNLIPQPEITVTPRPSKLNAYSPTQERMTFDDERTRDRFIRQARACGESVRLEYVNTLANGKELYNIYREQLVYGSKS